MLAQVRVGAHELERQTRGARRRALHEGRITFREAIGRTGKDGVDAVGCGSHLRLTCVVSCEDRSGLIRER